LGQKTFGVAGATLDEKSLNIVEFMTGGVVSAKTSPHELYQVKFPEL